MSLYSAKMFSLKDKLRGQAKDEGQEVKKLKAKKVKKAKVVEIKSKKK